MTIDSISPLVVVVSGGGPVGLTFSLNLTTMMGKQTKIIIYEGRWFVDENNILQWRDVKQGNHRRNQVVTLQDHVIKQMPLYVQEGLFKNFNERVWPTSRNIPIREVEDRLFELIQPFVLNGQVQLIPEHLHEKSDCIVKGTFDMLIGADGSSSFVRRYCNIQMVSEGEEYACGVAYDIPAKFLPTEEPLHQALNCILTVCQSRYLVNSSESRRGYLNVRLIESEYEELEEHLNKLQNCNKRCNLLDFNKYPETLVWTVIRQGLEYFKIPAKYVYHVLPIKINVCHTSTVVRELRLRIKEKQRDKSANTRSAGTNVKGSQKKYKTILACLVGDAALDVHFWPGRGMNSGMKGAIALARNIVRACASKTPTHENGVRTPLHYLDFLDYEGFMARLRAREQQGRSLRVLNDPINRSVKKYYSYTARNSCHTRYTQRLIKKLKTVRDRFQQRPDWPHQSRPITDEEFESTSKRILPHVVAQLSLANPWPTRQMGGREVLVEETFPFEQRNFLPVPTKMTNKELKPVLNQRSSYGVKQLPVVNRSPTQKMPSIETLIEDAFPFDHRNFLPISLTITDEEWQPDLNRISPYAIWHLSLVHPSPTHEINEVELVNKDTFLSDQETFLYVLATMTPIAIPSVDYFVCEYA